MTNLRRFLIVPPFVFFSCHLFAVDFIAICKSKKRPQGFDELVTRSLRIIDHTVQMGKEQSCRQAAEWIKEVQSVVVFDELEPMNLLEIFPNLKGISLTPKKRLTSLRLGHHPSLLLLGISGPVAIGELEYLTFRDSFTTFAIDGVTTSSWVDLSQVDKMSSINSIAFSNLTLKNSQAIEKLSNLEFLTFRNVKMDHEVRWERLPKLYLKDIK